MKCAKCREEIDLFWLGHFEYAPDVHNIKATCYDCDKKVGFDPHITIVSNRKPAMKRKPTLQRRPRL